MTDYNYIIYLLVGAIILPLQYHFTKYKQYKLCALLPTIPILGLLGLFIIIYDRGKDKGKVEDYLFNIILFVLCAFILYSIILSIYYLTNNILTSIIIALFVWCFIIYKLLTL